MTDKGRDALQICAVAIESLLMHISELSVLYLTEMDARYQHVREKNPVYIRTKAAVLKQSYTSAFDMLDHAIGDLEHEEDGMRESLEVLCSSLLAYKTNLKIEVEQMRFDPMSVLLLQQVDLLLKGSIDAIANILFIPSDQGEMAAPIPKHMD